MGYQSDTVEVTSAPGHLHYGAYSVAGDDWYEYAVTLYNAADDSIIQTTLYRGDSLSAYQFSYLTLPNVGSYYARFFLASYDRTEVQHWAQLSTLHHCRFRNGDLVNSKLLSTSSMI